MRNELDQALLKAITRRTLLKSASYGIGSLALSSMLGGNVFASMAQGSHSNPLAPKAPMFPAKAKNIIFLFMAGAPSQLDLLDYKPKLVQYTGQAIPAEFVKGERFAFIKGTPKLLGTPFKFEKVGKSGQEISELLPHLKEIADEIAIVRSMQTDEFNHAPGQIFMNTGIGRPERPSMGSWLTYGLGSECDNLPGFVVLISGDSEPDGGHCCWGSAFLPSVYQGVQFRSKGDPVLFVSNPDGVTPDIRRDTLDAMRDLNEMELRTARDPEIDTRISAYELAYKMQTSVPDLIDTSKEPASVHELYGTEPGKPGFAANCILARRLVERGVRFVQLYHRGWDNHGDSEANDIKHGLPARCMDTDRAAAALIKDLKQRGLLDSTIVVWAGEFGRTPMNEGRDGVPFPGRDHHKHAFSIWMAGGGVKPGITLGETDELGYDVVADPVHVHDLHATILRLMGIDHEKLTYKYMGRNFRLTDVYGNVINKLIA